jgi:hypothetical protein
MINTEKNHGPAASLTTEPEEPEIYWEKQGVSKLCGLHTINCILQGPFYDEVAQRDLFLKERLNYQRSLKNWMKKRRH